MKVTVEACTGFNFKVAFSRGVKVDDESPMCDPATIKIHEKGKQRALDCMMDRCISVSAG